MQSAPATQATLICEFVLLFVALPLAFRFKPFPFPPIPALWLLAGYCLWRLRSDPGFDRRVLWNAQELPHYLFNILLIFAVTAAVIGAGVYWLRPDLLLNF